MANCIECGLSIKATSEHAPYCWNHSPKISAEEKRMARIRGGLRSRKTPLPAWFNINNYLPLTPASIKAYYGDLLRMAFELYGDDASRFFKAQRQILPKAQEYAYLESLLELQARTEALESRRNGNKLLSDRVDDDNVITGEYSESN